MMIIAEILAGESKDVEFKESLPEKSIKYMKSVLAFDKEEVFKKMDAIEMESGTGGVKIPLNRADRLCLVQ